MERPTLIDRVVSDDAALGFVIPSFNCQRLCGSISGGGSGAEDHALRTAMDGALAIFKKLHRGQKIRYLHSGVQHLNKISGGDALALG